MSVTEVLHIRGVTDKSYNEITGSSEIYAVVMIFTGVMENTLAL